MRQRRRSASACSLGCIASLLLFVAGVFAQDDFDEKWPVEIELTPPQTSRPIQRPVGIVAGLDTTIYVGTVAGQIYLADVETGSGILLNPGGDDQRFGGLCLDSRGPATLYATGADSGVVFAFNRRGELLRKYQIDKPGKVFLGGCIQTRYQLIIVDSKNAQLYYLKLADEGPLRGSPPELEDTEFQGVLVPFEGEWEQSGNGLNAFGVEWTSKFNETVYIMNSATGELFTSSAKMSKVSGVLRKVEVMGKMDVFPGALQILFDSQNENIMYISMPHLNAVAVLEFSSTSPRRAKFIRMLTSPLLDGPAAIGEYGEWIYPVSGRFSKDSGTTSYSIIQVPRHRQTLDEDDPDQEFTTVLDEASQSPLPVVTDPQTIQQGVKEPPKPIGNDAPVAIDADSASSDASTSADPLSDDDEERPDDAETEEGDDDSAEEDPEADLFDSDADDTDEDEGENDDDDDESDEGEDSADEDEDEDEDSAEEEEDDDGDEPEVDEDGFPEEEADTSQVFSVNETEEPEEDSGASCFPGSATLQTESGLMVRMDELRLGQRVLVGVDGHGRNLFSEIFMFSHQDRSTISEFVRVQAADGHELELTDGHYLYVNNKLSAAKIIQPGDLLSLADGKPLLVDAVGRVRRKGLYNPQTLNGDIVVSGIRTSTFTTAVEPVVANSMLVPVRAAYLLNMGWPSRLSSWLSMGGGKLERIVPSGCTVYL